MRLVDDGLSMQLVAVMGARCTARVSCTNSWKHVRPTTHINAPFNGDAGGVDRHRYERRQLAFQGICTYALQNKMRFGIQALQVWRIEVFCCDGTNVLQC